MEKLSFSFPKEEKLCGEIRVAELFKQGSAQIANMHIAGGGGGKAGTHLAVRDLGLHSLEILTVNSHGFVLLSNDSNWNSRKIFTLIL